MYVMTLLRKFNPVNGDFLKYKGSDIWVENSPCNLYLSGITSNHRHVKEWLKRKFVARFSMKQLLN